MHYPLSDVKRLVPEELYQLCQLFYEEREGWQHTHRYQEDERRPRQSAQHQLQEISVY